MSEVSRAAPQAHEMTMIEKVARAIASAEAAYFGGTKDDEAQNAEQMWRTYEDQARAAIAAMIEPTEAMVEASVMPEYGEDLTRTKRGELTVGGANKGRYRAMIDAALKE